MKHIKIYLAAIICIFLCSCMPVKAATIPENAGKTKWSVKVSSSTRVTPPTYGNGRIYVASGSKVYARSKSTGAKLKESTTLTGTVGYAVIPVTYVKEYKLVLVTTIKGNNSYVTALDQDTLQVKWVSQGVLGQILTKLVYQDGNVYTGTWAAGETGSGAYYEINVQDGSVTTIQSRSQGMGGFYFAGAGVRDGQVFFGSEDGSTGFQKATLYSYNAKSKEPCKNLVLNSSTGDVRSQIIVDGEFLYFTSKAGYFHKVSVDETGKMSNDITTKLSGQSTSTPVILNGKAYVGVSNKTVTEIDLATMKITKTYKTPGYVQGEMLLKNGHLYMTYNQSPGGLYCINLETKKAYDIYIPKKSKRQYCISPVITDEEGLLFYKNDSGYIFAIENGVDDTDITAKNINYQSNQITWEKIAGATKYEVYQSTSYKGTYTKIATTTKLSYTKTGLKSNQTYYYKVRGYGGKFSGIKSAKTVLKGTSISLSAGSKKMKISWKKVTGASGYEIYQKTSSKGKWKKIKTITRGSTKTYTKTKLKKKRRYYYRMRVYRIQSKKKTYSSYSSVKNKKTK